MFHTKHLIGYADTINQAVDDLGVHLDKAAETGQEVDMLRQLGGMTMQVIGAAAFGCGPQHVFMMPIDNIEFGTFR